VATDYHLYFGAGKNPLNALRIWDGGLGIWGAIALGAVGALIGCRSKGIPLPAFADAVAPGIAVAQAIGRIGNYFNQELYGRTTDLPWALEIYERKPDALSGVAESHIPIDVVHPTFLYELLWNLGVAALVVWADRRFRLGHGRAFALYVASYTAGRTWIELMRADDATMVFGVRINVWVSILVFLGAVFYLVWAKRLGPREDLAALTADQRGAEDTTEPPADEAAAQSDEEPAPDAADKPAGEETDQPAQDAKPAEPADADAATDQPAGDREPDADEQPVNVAAGPGDADQPGKPTGKDQP
jgi:prolipoprotein diacylglyceryl transferase